MDISWLIHPESGDHKKIIPVVIGNQLANDREAKAPDIASLNFILPAVDASTLLIALILNNLTRTECAVDVLFRELSSLDLVMHMAAERNPAEADTFNYFVNRA
jgi:hypothetical protein